MNVIVFLDFDGVVRLPVFGWPPEAEFSREHLGRLRRVVTESGARIVISSDWRMRMDRPGNLAALGPEFGEGDLHPDWKTPDLSPQLGPLPRGEEIAAWLGEHPEVTRFVILDDLPRSKFGDLAGQVVRSHLETGLTEDLAREALRLLAE